MKLLVKKAVNRILSSFATKEDVSAVYRQVDCLMSVRDLVGVPGLLGPLRGWAISPDALLHILTCVIERRPAKLIEFGAGESTLAIGAVLSRLGSGVLTSIEHDAEYAGRIIARVRRAGLQDFVKVKIVPLREYSASQIFHNLKKSSNDVFKSYDLDIGEGNWDFGLVDGPPYDFGHYARSVPLKFIVENINPDGIIYLDDGLRESERDVVLAILEDRKNITAYQEPMEKGLFVFKGLDNDKNVEK